MEAVPIVTGIKSLQLHADLSVYPKFGVVKYSYIQAIVLSHYSFMPSICRPRGTFRRAQIL